jgi:hypothetical protein
MVKNVMVNSIHDLISPQFFCSEYIQKLESKKVGKFRLEISAWAENFVRSSMIVIRRWRGFSLIFYA